MLGKRNVPAQVPHWVPTALIVIILVWLAGPLLWREYVANDASVSFEIYSEYRIDGENYAGTAVWSGDLRLAKFPTSSAFGAHVIGEAIVLTGGDRNLFALRRAAARSAGREYGFFPLLCVPPKLSGDEIFDWLRNDFSGPCEVQDHKNFVPPELVSISDLNDPASVAPLSQSLDDDPASCDACIIKFQITRAQRAPQRNLSSILPWISGLNADNSDIVKNQRLRLYRSATESNYILMDFSWK